MPREADRLTAPIAPDLTRSARRDILRLERFGALYYSRRDCSTWVMPPHLAALLEAATAGSVLETYARNPEAVGLDEIAFAEKIAWWKRLGLIDDDYRCPALVIGGEPSTDATALTAPLATHIRLTSACNLHCRHCYVATTAVPEHDEITAAELDAAFAELALAGSPVVVLAGGEPLLRSDLFEILASLGRHQLDSFLCTNGVIIDRERAEALAAAGLRGVQVSLDGPDAETHDALRGARHFDQAVTGIRALVAAAAPGLQLRVTVTRHNAGRLAELAGLAARLGVPKVILKPFERVGGAPAELAIGRADYLAAIAATEDAWPKETGVDLEASDGIPRLLPEWTGVTPPFACVGGTTNVTIMQDATVAACGSVPSSRDWSLREHSLVECWREAPSIAAWRRLSANSICAACADLTRCRGGCRSRAVAACGSLDGPDPWAFCHDRSRVANGGGLVA